MNSLRLILVLFLATSLLGQQEIQRPRILGVAHIAFYTSDLAKARAFYEDFLGFQEPFTLKRDDGSVRIAFVKINDKQYVELFTDAAKEDGQLNHIAVYTDNAQQMRDYLAAHGIKVPGTVPKGKTGNYNFTIQDCVTQPNTQTIVSYQIVAVPALVGSTGNNAFCSDESGPTKVDHSGNGQACVAGGSAQ